MPGATPLKEQKTINADETVIDHFALWEKELDFDADAIVAEFNRAEAKTSARELVRV